MSRTLFISLAVLCAVGTLLGDEPKEAYDGPVVVLKNGTVLRGRGTNLGEKIAVELADGGEVKLPKGQVEVVADSLDDAYLQRREKLLPENVLSQINLAYWCLEQDMVEEAKVHLNAAKKVDPSHPGVTRLLRKIKEQTRLQDEELPEPVQETAPEPNLKELLKKRMEKARQHSAELGEVSPATKVRFNKDISPILRSACATSKCHSHDSDSDFRLVRSSAHSENHSVMTKRNLKNVVSRLNIDAPDESPLLENAAKAHAPGMKGAPLEISSREFSVLMDWVITATDDLNHVGGAMAVAPPPAPNGKAPATISPEGLPPASVRLPRNAPKEEESLEDELAPRSSARVADKSGKSGTKKGSKASRPREEEEGLGDPAEFNRKYFPDEPK